MDGPQTNRAGSYGLTPLGGRPCRARNSAFPGATAGRATYKEAMSQTGPTTLLLGTRGSGLALAQSRMVADLIGPGVELVTFSTRGDRTPGALTEVGGKGLFTAELEAALRSGQVQLAVHSAKDMPAEMEADLVIAAVPPREDARDALIGPPGGLDSLPQGARVGTSSFRRGVQLKALRPDLEMVPLRGNVETRLRKCREGAYDAVVLALAGLNRLGLSGRLGGQLHPLEIEQVVPAAGQGALAVQCLADNASIRGLLARINDPSSEQALHGERWVVARLKASCHSSLGVHIRPRGQAWQGLAMASDTVGSRIIRADSQGATAYEAAIGLYEQLARAGAEALLASPELP